MTKKRKRGAQPGNKNALKHGFYSAIISPEEISLIWNLVNLKDLDPYIAVLRVKLAVALEHSPDNHRLLEDAAKVLTKKTAAGRGLNQFDARQLRAAILCAFEFSHNSSHTPAGQNEAGQSQTALRNQASLFTLKPRRKTNRACQPQMAKQNKSRLSENPFSGAT